MMNSMVLQTARPIALVLLLTSTASLAWGETFDALDAPTLAVQAEGFFKTRLTVTAGPSGAPGGFTLWWMKGSDYNANGGWFLNGNPAQWEASFQGQPTSNIFAGDAASYVLGPNERITVECGDLFDETGVTHSSDILDPDTRYVFAAFANAWADVDGHWEQSALSANVSATTMRNPNCTQGFWKTHGPEPCQEGNNANEWPTDNLTLGTVNYTDLELCSIFQEPAAGNGLISLAHQLITAEFNVLIGANSTCIEDDLAAAHALIDGLVVPPVGGGFLHPSVTGALTQTLDDYNNGMLCQQHDCTIATEATSWGAIKGMYR
jgi:hypothetical protein